MRIVRDDTGQFYIDDEPLVLVGSAADAFLAEMGRELSAPEREARRLFIAECERIPAEGQRRMAAHRSGSVAGGPG